MEKKGAKFDLSWPHLNPGTVYYFPGNREERKRQNNFLLENKKELTEKLLPFVKEELEFFYKGAGKYFPNKFESKLGMGFEIANGGKYFILGEDLGGQIVGGHNIDYFFEDAISFNSASKLIELITPGIETPKILHDENKTLYYPLPNNSKLLNVNNKDYEITPNLIQKWYDFMKLGESNLILENDSQKIENEYGNILIENGSLKTIPNIRPKEFSWIASRLMTCSWPKN